MDPQACPLNVPLTPDGPVLTPTKEWSSVYTWRTHWHEALRKHVAQQHPWALLGCKDGAVVLFDTSDESLFKCAGWATSVRFVFPESHGWEPIP